MKCWKSLKRLALSQTRLIEAAFISFKFEWIKVKRNPLICSPMWPAELKGTNGHKWSVWPDLGIYWTLGSFSKPLATINLPKSPTFLGNFCKGVKIIHFSSEISFRQLFFRHLAIFFWSHCKWCRRLIAGALILLCNHRFTYDSLHKDSFFKWWMHYEGRNLLLSNFKHLSLAIILSL